MPMCRIFPQMMVILMCAQGATAQISPQVFKISLVGGTNFTQIDGDKYMGYRKPGIQAGLMGIVQFSKSVGFSAGVQFSQRGAKPSKKEKTANQFNYIDIRLNYVELPIVINFLSNRPKGADYYKTNIYGGLSIARLSSVKIKKFGNNEKAYQILTLDTYSDQFSDFDYSLITGFAKNFNKVLGIYFQHLISVTPAFLPPNEKSPLRPLNLYHVSIGLVLTVH